MIFSPADAFDTFSPTLSTIYYAAYTPLLSFDYFMPIR